MADLTALCVYCGSSVGFNPRHQQAARKLGAMLAERGVTLVYGGGRIGLMGVIADSVLANGGRVVGIIPHHLDLREVGHRGASELHVVDSMHIRKNQMFELSDAILTAVNTSYRGAVGLARLREQAPSSAQADWEACCNQPQRRNWPRRTSRYCSSGSTAG